ncbi:YggS family pyridoxal phosphate-dependent enzyme [Alteromonas oceanisediminis]|uniref:YggS family pyridoxal phosphate-dependent enzyme n=1 Tax=Alteromonas oceanisediminis TaxID=2836180 RepID=UPI001BDA9FF7|nr:YggS family pyridoxal phosphate-dependent enzyme [Alteromonas oceanisediminis]MBT0585492.1 YggS family pyridoxal phosphate-dependent enzyme [Alteromonas oceanisediminis]
MQTIADSLHCAQNLIAQSLNNANRPANAVKLLAVSKTKPVSDLRAAYIAGQRLFGENYVQEGVSKIEALQDLKDIEWHFIGPLQSNKTRLVAEHFDWVHSVDRLKIAGRLSDQRPHYKGPMNVCIQVNIDDEESKSGVSADEVGALADAVSSCVNLRLRGLMTIPNASQNNTQLDQSFQRMATLFTDLKGQYSTIDTLSMGMSGDLDQAISAGSTMVRLGTAIFGART